MNEALGIGWPQKMDSRTGGVNPVLLTWLALLLVAIAGIWIFLRSTGGFSGGPRSAPGPGTVLSMGLHEIGALEAVWDDRKGFLVWSSTMYGQHDLIRMDWPGGRLTHLTQGPFVDTAPKISPDGKWLAFARSRREWVSSRNLQDWDVWVLDFNTGQERLLAERGAAPSWTADGKAVVFHREGREIVRAELKTGAETVLLAAPEGTVWTDPALDPAGNRVAATVHAKKSSAVLLALPAGAETHVAAGGQMLFAPGGDGLVLVAEEGGRMNNRICRADRNGQNLETWLDLPGFWSREYFPRVSNDGALLVFGAARDEGAFDTADFEIFLWRVGDPPERAARVSFHTGNDLWPDVWVQPPRARKTGK